MYVSKAVHNMEYTGKRSCNNSDGSPTGHIGDSFFDHLMMANKNVENLCTLINFLLSKFFYSPTDAQVNCLKNNFKIYIKIDIKTAPTCFGAITIIRERIIRSC
jgi:hypothetical protein